MLFNGILVFIFVINAGCFFWDFLEREDKTEKIRNITMVIINLLLAFTAIWRYSRLYF